MQNTSHHTACILKVIQLENRIVDVQNVLGLYQQWTDETKSKIVLGFSFKSI